MVILFLLSILSLFLPFFWWPNEWRLSAEHTRDREKRETQGVVGMAQTHRQTHGQAQEGVVDEKERKQGVPVIKSLTGALTKKKKKKRRRKEGALRAIIEP